MSGRRGLPGPESRTGLVRPAMSEAEFEQRQAGGIADPSAPAEPEPTARPSPIRSRSSGRPAKIGWTSTGKHIIVVYEVEDLGGLVVARPVTAYEIEP